LDELDTTLHAAGIDLCFAEMKDPVKEQTAVAMQVTDDKIPPLCVCRDAKAAMDLERLRHRPRSYRFDVTAL
jgi:hypothetical protein